MISQRTFLLLLWATCSAAAQNLVVDATRSHMANSFSPRSLGAGVDRIGVGRADKMLVNPMLKEILASGWQSVTYRQNTELHAEAWHWNPQGTLSDPKGQGYFTGSATPTEMIRHSWGYALPHRGMSRGCDSGGGTFSLIQVDRDHPIRGYLSQYFASQLITREWVEPVDSMHRVFRESSDVHDADGNTLVTAYALLRPDGQWSLLAVNKDHDNPHRVHIAFRDADAKTDRSFSGPVALLTFGSAQYQWHPDSWADPDGPPAKSVINAEAGTLFELPKASIMVIRGKMGPQQVALESEPSLTAPSS